MKKMLWGALCLMMVAALALSSCNTTTVEKEKEGQTVTGKVTEKEASKETEGEEAETVAEEKGPEMVKDIKGRLVEKPRYGGTVRMCEASNPEHWDPYMHEHGGGGGRYWFQFVYGTFTVVDWSIDRSEYSFDSTTYNTPDQAVGQMMESYEHPDPLTYIVHLRKGMHFEDKPPANGREFTAEDVRRVVYRQLGMGEFSKEEGGAGRSPFYPADTWKCLIGGSVEVVDKYTVKFNLPKPNETFSEYWGTEIGIWMYAPEMYEAGGQDWGWEHVISIGPWRLVDYMPDVEVVFKRNPNFYYWDDNFPENMLPYPDNFRMSIIPDESTRLAALRTGKIDVYGPSWVQAEGLMKTNPELKWRKRISPAPCAVLDSTMKPWDDLRVRKAMQMAVDLEEITRDYYKGITDPYPFYFHKALGELWTPLEELPEETQEGFRYNPEKAKQLLTEAGYPGGFKQTFTISSTHNTEWRELTNLLISYWKDIGIETEINVIEPANYISYFTSTHGDLVWSWASGYWMPTQVLEYRYSKTWYNYGRTADPVFDKYRDDAMALPYGEERNRTMKEAAIYATSQFYHVACPVRAGYMFWQPWLKGYQGETCLGSWQQLPVILARAWVDQDLKYEMTGSRD